MSRDRMNEWTRPLVARQQAADTDEDEYTESDRAAARRASNYLLRQYSEQIQRKEAAAAPPPEAMHAAAAQGAATTSQALPHADRIQASFGPEHDVSGIRAHIDPTSTRAMAADAYATGNDVVFGGAPDLHTAAHEAAHVVQQSQGVNLQGGVGEAGDEHERQADAIADRVVRGESARDLLGSGTTGTPTQQGSVQRKEKAPWDYLPKEGVSADDVVGAGDGKLNPRVLAPQDDMRTGDPAIDDGPACERQSTAPGCFLNGTRRSLLQVRLISRIDAARENYRLALTNIKFETLLQKEEDLHWALAIALELAGGRLLSIAQNALKAGRARGLAALGDAELKNLLANESSEVNQLTMRAMATVSEQSLDNVSRAAFDQVKQTATAATKDDRNASTQESKASQLSYVSTLKDQSGAAFDKFASLATAGTDAEMVVLFKAMHPNEHTEEKYTASLKAKIDRFMKSGVTEVGTTVHPRGKNNIERDVRVVYVRNAMGHSTPWFQSQEGIDEIGAERKTSFGPQYALAAARLREPVPAEFRDIAIARSEMLWGPTPTIDDPSIAHFKSVGSDITPQQNSPGQSVVAGSRTVPSNAAVLQPVPLQGDESLPPGSIFSKTRED